MRIHSRELRIAVLAALCCCAASAHPAARQAPAAPQPVRPFGTLRELATMQQRWLRQTEDFREGVKAMNERRLPDFRGQ